MKRVIAFGVFLILISFSFVSASVEVSEGSVVISEYKVGEVLQGALNIKISEESVDEELRFVLGGEETKISVKDFLDVYEVEDLYGCNPTGCEDDFKVDGAAGDSKTFSLSSSVNRSIGFVLNGEGVEILDNGFSFDVSSDVGSSCSSQLSIDVSSDEDVDWENDKSLTAQSCDPERTSECYDEGSFDSWFLIGEEPYCERIVLGKGPAFQVKALMKKADDADFAGNPLVARIYGEDKIEKGNCELSEPSTGGSVGSCVIDYVSKTDEEQFVCVSTKAGANNEGYSLKARETGEFCGFLGDPGQVSQDGGDYAISVSAKKYDAIGEFSFDDDVMEAQTGSPLDAEANDYITNRYGDDCPDAGCIIPFVFSGVVQEVTIDDVELKYKNAATNQVIKNDVYFLESTPAILNMEDFVSLDISDNGIELPSVPGDYMFELYFGGEKLLEEEITLAEADTTSIDQIHPRSVPATVKTKFIVFVDSEFNLSELSFEWDFGGVPLETSEPFVEATLSTLGEEEVGVKVYKGFEEIASSSFMISVGSPKEAVGETITEYKTRLSDLNSQKAALPDSYQVYLEEVASISQIESRVNEIESQYLALSVSDDTEDSVYVGMMNDLLDERVPRSIRPSSISDVRFLYEFNDLNLDDFSLLFGQAYSESQEEEYRGAIFNWFVNNVDVMIKHKTYSVYYDDVRDGFVSEFELSVEPNSGLSGEGYLVIERDREEVVFENGIVPASQSGVAGVSVDLSQSQTIKFSIEEEVDSFSLPMYFAPSFSILSIGGGNVPSSDQGLGFWSKFLIGLILVLVVVFILYYFLQEWYKKNYEKSLFKNKNDLYNLLNFIKNSRSKKMSDSQIVDKLSKAKWKRGQINYALKVYSGKRVGMWEIPLFKGRNKKKMEREMAKRRKVARI